MHLEKFANANVKKNVKKVNFYDENIRKTAKNVVVKKIWIVKDRNSWCSFNVFYRFYGKIKTKVKGHICRNLANEIMLGAGCNAKLLYLWCVNWGT